MNKTIIYLLIMVSGCCMSCTDWLTIQPEDTLSKDEMFESKSGFYDALYGVYTLCDNNYGHNGDLTSYLIEHLAAQWEVKSESNEEKMRSHQYNALDQQLGSVFTNQYKVIANINLVLEYLEVQDFLSKEDYRLIKGECLGLRAWLHFDLIRLWGPMPSNVNEGKLYLPYVTKVVNSSHVYYVYNEYMKLLTDDMKDAESLLPDLTDDERNYRLNLLGVKSLLARINLWQGNKTEALKYANEVINFVNTDQSEQYALGTLDDIGSENYAFTREHIFGRYDDFESVSFRNSLYNNTSFLDDLFEFSSSDIRFKQWEDRDIEGLNEPAMNLLKYMDGEASVPIIRLSEIYFIAMECGELTQANDLFETFAIVRGIPIENITNKQQLDNILYREYRKEFIGEGVMFYYYKRHETVKIPRNPDVCTDKCYILPLPKKEIDVNS